MRQGWRGRLRSEPAIEAETYVLVFGEYPAGAGRVYVNRVGDVLEFTPDYGALPVLVAPNVAAYREVTALLSKDPTRAPGAPERAIAALLTGPVTSAAPGCARTT